MNHAVYWRRGETPSATPLRADASGDVAVVGGGMAGLTCADVLARRGLRVILLEQDLCGAGASGQSSGFVTPDSELSLHDLVTSLGQTRGRRLWDFACGGVARIRGTIEGLGIDCDYRVQDSLFVARSARAFRDVVEPEHQTHAAYGGDSTLYGPETLGSVLAARACHGGVRYGDTFGIDSYAYCRGLRDALARSGVPIHEGTPVLRLTASGVETPHGQVKAHAVAVFTDRWLASLGLAPDAVGQVQTFLAVSKPLRDEELRAILPAEPLMVWDTDLVYQYFRAIGGGRLLVGASDLRETYTRRETRDSPRVLRRMRRYLARQFPSVRIELEWFWPGRLGVSKDFLPILGQGDGPQRVFFAGAGAGLPWAAALGAYVADRITQGRSELDGEFSPERRFAVGSRVQRVLGKPLSFALSHAAAKYLRR